MHKASAFFVSSAVYADTIELTNGKTIEATFTGREGDTVKFDVDGISMSFQAKDVKNISMGAATTAEKAPAKKGAAVLSGGNRIVVPVGTLLEFKLSQPLQKK